MSEFIYRPGVNRLLLTNTSLQNKNDEWIQFILNNYKYYEEKKEFDENTGDDVDLVISHKPIIPDLVIYNKTFNKNNCFIEGNIKERNNFPRKQFVIRFTEKDKEQLKKFNLNRKNKEREKKNENFLQQDSKKDNNDYINNYINNNKNKDNGNEEIQKNEIKIENMDKNADKINEEKEKVKDMEGEEDEKESDNEVEKSSEENEDEDEKKEEKENYNNPKEQLKNEEKKNFNINNNNFQNFDEGISNLCAASKESYEFYPKNYKKNTNQKNNNMNINNNFNNNILNNNSMKDTNNINQNFECNNLDNISLSEEISQKGDLSIDASFMNHLNNIMDNTNSQLGNDSFINKNNNNPNQFTLLNANNMNNINNLNNFGFPNNNNMSMNNTNELKLKLLLLQQQNNNNYFNQMNNNNFNFNSFSANQNYMNNLNMLNNNGNNRFSFNPLQNNFKLNIQDNFLKITLDCMDKKGWRIFSQDGNFINEFTSLELFQYLTETIVDNIKLDNLYISNKNLKERMKGGIMYMKLLDTIPAAYQIMEDQLIKQIELKKNILYTTSNLNSNIGAGNIFANNNLNFNLNNMNNNMNLNSNNNYLMNNLNDNAFSK